jgi:methylthioribose-1-phosphate isomerase
MALEAIRFENGRLLILDQLQLPHIQKYTNIESSEDGWLAIKEMRVRGAPAIAIVAALALAAEVHALVASGRLPSTGEEVEGLINGRLKYLESSRPTAVNLHDAVQKLGVVIKKASQETGSTGQDVAMAYMKAAEQMLVDDVKDNEMIGHFGRQWILENTVQGRAGEKVAILTHCNTG